MAPLFAGARLGSYEVLSALGSGGMGEVYKARDLKLGRDVAIKMLPAAVANDPEGRRRLAREAHLLASLNHPNIATVYGLEQSEDRDFLVMELVPGQTLHERLLQARLGLPDALHICRQIAEALEAAHERGVIHRDLKPANIKITPEERVKVLDFGLAKDLAAAALPDSATEAVGLTRAGTILGTAAYMSPEQARGKTVDRRTDIWAFGCVLYETLAGRRAFDGDSASDMVAAALTREPDWSAVPAETPASIHRLLRRCLSKDARQRLHDIGDARLEIEETLAPAMTSPAPVASQRTLTRAVRLWAALLVAAIALGIGWVWRGATLQGDRPMVGETLGGSAMAFGPRISPDGHTLAFQAMVDNQNQVAVQTPASGNFTVLTHEKGRGFIVEISWSRDGARIFYDRLLAGPIGIFSVPAVGGEPRLVLENAIGPQALPDGSLLVTKINAQRKYQLHRFWPQTGRLEALGALLCDASYVPPVRAFPDGREAVFFGTPLATPDAPEHLFAIDLGSGTIRRLAGDVTILEALEYFPLATDSQGQAALIDLPAGNLHRIVAVPRDGSSRAQTMVTLTLPPWYLDTAADGTVYADQVDRRVEVLRFSVSGGVPERIAGSPTSLNYSRAGIIALHDERVLIPSVQGGRERLLVATEGTGAVPFVDTEEETAAPAAVLGERELAFLIGTGPKRGIAIASIDDGRLLRRLRGATGSIQGLAGSPDGKTLYYVKSGQVWSVPANDGETRRIHAGDGVTVDPRDGAVIVRLNEAGRGRLLRLSDEGGSERNIPLPGELALDSIVPLVSNAISKGGRLITTVYTRDSWFFHVAVLDLSAGTAAVVPVNYVGDVFMPGWLPDGRVVSLGTPPRASLWRFRKAEEKATSPR